MRQAEVVVDIETVGRKPTHEDVEMWRSTWKPPANYKNAAAIEAKRKEDEQKWWRRRALELGGAQIVSIAVGEILGGRLMNEEVRCTPDESYLMRFFAEYMNEFSGNCKVIGHNIQGFDLPMLACSMHRHNVSLEYPIERRSIVDTLYSPLKDRKGLKVLAHAFGISRMTDLDGSRVGELFEAGLYDTIAEYNLDDIRITATLFVALSRIYKL